MYTIVTEAVVSKGFDGAAALRFSENGTSVQFRIGEKQYDPKAENNTRWLNLSVKAFGQTCERIRKMQLGEGSSIHLCGELKEEAWVDAKSGEAKSQLVIIAYDVGYASGGSGSKAKRQERTAGKPSGGGSGFTGFEPFGGGSFF